MEIHRNLFLVLIVFFISCETKTKDKTEKTSKQIIKKETVEVEKPKEKYDLETFAITDENVVEFLTWYGERNKENKVLIETEFGTIEVELYNETPLHRANFIYLTKKNYFNTTYFHRVVKNFIIQGGSSDETITQKERKAIGKYLIPAEFRSQLRHNYGAMAAAREWEKNPEKKSNPFEFYFIQNKKGSHHLNGEHTVFGRITKGFNVMDKIASQETDPGEYPLLNIKIKVSIQ